MAFVIDGFGDFPWIGGILIRGVHVLFANYCSTYI
jgi:hypothetical protein